MSDEGTVTDEVRIREFFEQALRPKPTDAQLYAAYEQQEKELVDAKAEIEVLEKEIVDRETEKEAMDNLLMEKDLKTTSKCPPPSRPSGSNTSNLNSRRWKRSTPVRRTASGRSSPSRKSLTTT